MSPRPRSFPPLDPALQARLHDAARLRAHALREAAIHGLIDRGQNALAQGARRLGRRITLMLTPAPRSGLGA